jgi:iron complex outermembrane receptor protein
VVNIILKKSMEGGQLSLYTGRNEKGDGKNKDFSLTYGAGSDKANLMFGVSHTEQGVVWPSSRKITSTTYGPAHPTDNLGAAPWGRITPVLNGASNTTASKGGFNKILNHTGSYDGQGTGADSRDRNNYHDYTGKNNDDKYNTSQDMMFSTPTKLDTLFTKGSIELPKDMKFTTTAMYSQRKSDRQIAGYPLTSTTQSKFPVFIDKDSYYNPYGSQVPGAGTGQDLYFARRTIERPRISQNENRTIHVDATLEGEFALRGLPWNWSTGANYSSFNGSTLSTGNVNLLTLKKALGPSFKNAAGVVQCGTAANPIALAECTPFDILGGPSASNDKALDYIMSTGQGTYGSTTKSFVADVSGELYQLPAGALGLAAGVEHRDVSGYDRPGQFEQSGYSTDLAGNPTVGKYTVKEAYAELNIPVLKNKPFAQLLSFDVATRHSDYSNFGSTNNSKISFMWKPVKDLLTRGTYAQGFRAPNVGDTFGGGAQTFDKFIDPCDTKYGQVAKDPSLAARCLATGAGASFRQVDQSGAAVGNAGAQSLTAFVAGAGNTNLTPETAVTKTLGFVYSPSFLPAFSGSLDWYNISVNNRIVSVSAQYVMNECIVSNSSSFCGAFKRDPVTGQIMQLARGNANLGQMTTEGIDMSLSYKFKRSAYGQFTIRNETSYVDSFKVKSSATSDWVNYAGEYNYNRVKSNTNIDWNMGNWASTWGMRYLSPVKDQCWNSTTECNMAGAKASWGTDVNKLGALVYHDVNVSYKTSWNGKIAVGVNNVFDKKPRISYSTQTDASSVDADLPIDRFVYVRYNQAF